MQTVYYTTANFIRHHGNVVDLTEYRRRMERAADRDEGALCRGESERRPALSAAVRPAREGMGPGLFLDFCASAAIVILTTVTVAQFLVK